MSTFLQGVTLPTSHNQISRMFLFFPFYYPNFPHLLIASIIASAGLSSTVLRLAIAVLATLCICANRSRSGVNGCGFATGCTLTATGLTNRSHTGKPDSSKKKHANARKRVFTAQSITAVSCILDAARFQWSVANQPTLPACRTYPALLSNSSVSA